MEIVQNLQLNEIIEQTLDDLKENHEAISRVEKIQELAEVRILLQNMQESLLSYLTFLSKHLENRKGYLPQKNKLYKKCIELQKYVSLPTSLFMQLKPAQHIRPNRRKAQISHHV